MSVPGKPDIDPIPAYTAIARSRTRTFTRPGLARAWYLLSSPWHEHFKSPGCTCRASSPRGRMCACVYLVSRCTASRGTIPERSRFRTGHGSGRGGEDGDTTGTLRVGCRMRAWSSNCSHLRTRVAAATLLKLLLARSRLYWTQCRRRTGRSLCLIRCKLRFCCACLISKSLVERNVIAFNWLYICWYHKY